MTARFDLLFVSSYARSAPLPTRSARLLAALRANEAVRSVTTVDRRRPTDIGRFVRRRSLAVTTRVEPTLVAIEHPMPFGALEACWIDRFVRRTLEASDSPVVLWIADPKSASVLGRLRDVPAGSLVRTFDAFDAWDLSPLVRGRWRRRAVAAGYRDGARHADIVFANTPFMVRRMQALGATDVTLLRNAAPPVPDTNQVGPHRRGEPFLVYVGRIHERLDAGLLAAVARAFPDVQIRLIGPIERVPGGWSEMIELPNVRFEAAMVGEHLRDVLADAVALLIPHHVDDYTRSQDAMKAWDALAVGTLVIAPPLPPVDGWPTGLAIVAADRAGFIAGVRRALEGDAATDRGLRLRYARDNGWDARAASVVRAVGSVTQR